MEAAPVPIFDKAEFIAAVSAAVAKAAPKTLDDADKFSSSGASDGIASEVKGSVDRSKQASAAPMTDASQKPADATKATDKHVTPVPQENPPATPAVDLTAAMPAKAPAEQTNLMNGPAETNARMADAEVTEEQLARSNEPEFTNALAAKKEGEDHSRTAPVAVREFEAQQLAASRQDAAAAGAQGVQSMIATRSIGQTQVRTTQSATQLQDEQKRADVSARVKSIFDATKSDVDGILGGLDALVDKAFTDGERDCKNAFTADIAARMEKYKDDRYSGITGWARWTEDLFLSLPPEVNQLYVASKQLYENRMNTVISTIADLIGRELNRAKDRVAQGRREINTYLGTLEPSLRSIGHQAAGQIGAQFDALTDSITEKGKSLADDVAEKYVAARQAVDDEIVAMQEQNKGLWDKAKDLVGGAIETILKLKDLLAGVLARAAGAVGKIIKDPIGFLGNFVTAVKTGVMNFGSHILQHLEKGLQSWLFGTLADAGIEIPEKLDLKGIVSLILSLLGLTWTSIRARLAKVLPEWVLKALESAVDVVRILSTEGVGGLWKFIVDKITDLEDQVLGQIKDFVITKIITAGITWLISLLNPAAAFIKACKLIYDGVMWFVDNADRLKDFVDSVLDSVESIAAGGVGRVAELIESTLGKAVPMVISGLASLLGLGGIADKIKEILQTVQKPVGKILDSIIAGVIKYGKQLLGKLKPKGKDERTPAERKAALDKAMSAGQEVLKQESATESQIRTSLMKLKSTHNVKKLDLVVDARTAETETVHLVGANSPTIHSEPIVRYRPTVQRADESADVSAAGPATRLDVGGDIYTVWNVSGTSVRVQLEPGLAAEVKSGSSAAAAINQLVGSDLEMDRADAVALAHALEEAGFLSRQLLLHYVRKQSAAPGNLDPEMYAAGLVRRGSAMTAAVQRPAAKTARSMYVDVGVDEQGQQREGPLSNIAQVFYARRHGEWIARQIQSRANTGGSQTIEFIWHDKASSPSVISLGSIEVDDDGAVVRILEVNSTNVPGGRAQMAEIMTKAGWRLRLDPSGD